MQITPLFKIVLVLNFSRIALALGWGLGYFGQLHILTNFMAIDDVKKIKYAKYVGLTWQIIVLTASVTVGIVALGYFSYDGVPNPELIFILMAKELLPGLIAGFALCGIFAAALSSMDSFIMIAGSIIAEDLYKKFTQRTISQRNAVILSRIGSSAIALIALFIAHRTTSSVYLSVNYAWSGLGSSFGPVIIAALYSQTINKYGAVAGMIIGALVSALWPYTTSTLLPLVPGFFCSTVALYVVSNVTKNISATGS